MIILDLDNCIADDEWRIPHIQWQHTDPHRRYHSYHMLAPWDKVKNRELFKGRGPIAIFTGRALLYREFTVEWLKRAGVEVAHLLMRNNHDRRTSVELKRTQLQHLISFYGVPMNSIERAYDDRPEIVDMYRAHGLQAEVRFIHSADAYTNPHSGATRV